MGHHHGEVEKVAVEAAVFVVGVEVVQEKLYNENVVYYRELATNLTVPNIDLREICPYVGTASFSYCKPSMGRRHECPS